MHCILQKHSESVFGHSDEIFPRSVWRWMLKANFKHAANFTELPPVFNLAYLAKFAAITI